jgi:hypothetical protein
MGRLLRLDLDRNRFTRLRVFAGIDFAETGGAKTTQKSVVPPDDDLHLRLSSSLRLIFSTAGKAFLVDFLVGVV